MIPSRKAISSGGIVLKTINGVKHIILVKLPKGIYVFPKGHIETNETPEIAALREVREETGLSNLRIIKKLGVFTRPATEKDGTPVIKDIHLYLMTTNNWKEGHKDEDTLWVPLSDAETLMYPQEADFLRQHINLLN